MVSTFLTAPPETDPSPNETEIRFKEVMKKMRPESQYLRSRKPRG